MMNLPPASSIAPAIFLLSMVWLADASERGEEFASAAQEKIADQFSVAGEDSSWLFLSKELRHLATGKFWEKPWGEVAKNGSNPIEVATELVDALAEVEVELLLVPIPTKASIYPEKLVSGYSPGDSYTMRPLIESFEESGVATLDLETLFLEHRASHPSEKLFCEQDAHFSPLAAELIADAIANRLGLAGMGDLGSFNVSEPSALTITGDLVVGSIFEGKLRQETLTRRIVTLADGQPLTPDPRSPLLLMGDSHTLVFHQGKSSGMHCTGSGVFEHLSAAVGFPIDLVGVRGSGMVQARKQLYYRVSEHPQYWLGKRALVWMFSAREFTQSSDRVVPIPIE